MGAKTALLAFADGDIRAQLGGASRSDRNAAESLVRKVHPGFAVEPFREGTLRYTYPPDGGRLLFRHLKDAGIEDAEAGDLTDDALAEAAAAGVAPNVMYSRPSHCP